MKKTIVILSNNRPQYLEKMLLSLKANHLAGWEIFVHSEPPGVGMELVRQHFPLAPIVVQPMRMGSPLHQFASMFRMFETVGSDLVLYLEDDLLLSPDLLDLVNWYGDQEIADCMALCAYNDTFVPETDPSLLRRYYQFTTMCYAVKREHWPFFRKHFFWSAAGWDHSLHAAIKANPNLFTIDPLYSRVMHIGEHGLHFTPEHQKRLFSNRLYWQLGSPGNYRLL